MKNIFVRLFTLILASAGLSVPAVSRADADSDLAQALANPLASIISIPFQFNYDQDIGTNDAGERLTTNIQPVYPVDLNKDWNLITRPIIPVIYQDDIIPGEGSQFGLGDVLAQFYFSPKQPTAGGAIWGVGPLFLLPTGGSDFSAEKWAAGPAGVILKVSGPWTYGFLANHIWSFAGDDDGSDISSTFMQPFVSYTWPSAWGASLQTETTYNWKTEQWSVPVNAAVSKLVKFGKLPVNLQFGVGYWLDSPDTAAEGWRLRAQMVFVLPK